MSGPGLFGNKFFSQGTKVARKASIIALDNNNSIKEGFFEQQNALLVILSRKFAI